MERCLFGWIYGHERGKALSREVLSRRRVAGDFAVRRHLDERRLPPSSSCRVFRSSAAASLGAARRPGTRARTAVPRILGPRARDRALGNSFPLALSLSLVSVRKEALCRVKSRLPFEILCGLSPHTQPPPASGGASTSEFRLPESLATALARRWTKVCRAAGVGSRDRDRAVADNVFEQAPPPHAFSASFPLCF